MMVSVFLLLVKFFSSYCVFGPLNATARVRQFQSASTTMSKKDRNLADQVLEFDLFQFTCFQVRGLSYSILFVYLTRFSFGSIL